MAEHWSKSEARQRQAGEPGRANDSSTDREGLRVQVKVKEAGVGGSDFQ